jgi:tRNA threonylcarbamoyladenosine biosynthesis protein TsaE
MIDNKIISSSELETRNAASNFAEKLQPGDVVALTGPLGSGKTCFARGIITALHGEKELFHGSPTFAIVQEYADEPEKIPIYHFDFYRIKQAEELLNIGWQEYYSGEGICLVEWANLFPEVMPPNTKWVNFSAKNETTREIGFEIGN